MNKVATNLAPHIIDQCAEAMWERDAQADDVHWENVSEKVREETRMDARACIWKFIELSKAE